MENAKKPTFSQRVKQKASRFFSMKTVVVVFFFWLRLIIDFCRETAYHLSHLFGRYTDYTSTYSITYAGVMVLVCLFSYAGVSADYDVLYGYFHNVTFDIRWSSQLALVTAISIGIGLFVTTSNITGILSAAKYKKKNAPLNYVDHRIQLSLNSIFFLICISSTIGLSINSNQALETRTNIIKIDAESKKDARNNKNASIYRRELALVERDYRRDSTALFGRYSSLANAASAKYQVRVQQNEAQIKKWKAKKARNWGEKQYIESQVRKIETGELAKNKRKIQEKESEHWAAYHKAMIPISDTLKSARIRLKKQYLDKNKEDNLGINSFIREVEENSLASSTLFMFRNIFMNGGVVILTLMLSLYFKGTKKDVKKRKKKDANQNTDTAANSVLIEDTPPRTQQDTTEDTTKTQQDTTPNQRGRDKVVIVTSFKDHSKLCKRARRRFELAHKDKSAEETRQRNMYKSMSDLAFLQERGFSAAIEGGKLSVVCDGKGVLSDELEHLVQTYSEDIKVHREAEDDLSEYRK